MASSFIPPNPATFDSFRFQNFSFPADVISHISKNPISPDGLLKLPKSCKYFFIKNQIIVVSNLDFGEKFFIIGKNKKKKYWLTGDVILYSIPLNFLKNLKIHKKDLTLNEMDFLLNGGKIEILCLDFVNIRDKKGVIVPINKILEKVPNIFDFEYDCENEIFTNETFKKMNGLKFNTRFNRFHLILSHIAEDIDFSILCEFIKKNATEKSLLCFIFYCANQQFFKNAFATAFKKSLKNCDLKEKFYVARNFICFNQRSMF